MMKYSIPVYTLKIGIPDEGILRILASYEAKTARISNFRTFWAICLFLIVTMYLFILSDFEKMDY